MNALTEQPAGCAVITETAAQVDAGGTMWRLRSLIAMGHDAGRMAAALKLSPQLVEKVLRSLAGAVSAELRDLVCQLWDAWWDKHPPELSRSDRRAVGAARRRAERCGWCPPLGLNKDELDEPGYRPYSRYREATASAPQKEFAQEAPRKPAGGRHEANPPACHSAITGWRAAATNATAARAQPG